MEFTREQVLAFGSEWLGVPFRLFGRGRDGIDCMGLVLEFYRAHGIELPDPGSADKEEVLSADLARFFVRVPAPSIGCVVYMPERHLGIHGGDHVLHVLRRSAVVRFPFHRPPKQFAFYELIAQ